MHMDDRKVLAKLATLIKTIDIYQQGVGTKLGIEKCAILILNSGKEERVERIELLNQENIRPLAEKKKYKYLGILEANTIKQVQMNEKLRKKKE